MYLGVHDVKDQEITATGYQRHHIGGDDFRLAVCNGTRVLRNARRIKWPDATETWFDVDCLVLYTKAANGERLGRVATLLFPRHIYPGEALEVAAGDLVLQWSVP